MIALAVAMIVLLGLICLAVWLEYDATRKVRRKCFRCGKYGWHYLKNGKRRCMCCGWVHLKNHMARNEYFD